MSPRMWSKGNPVILLMGTGIGAATVESSMVVSLKAKNRTTISSVHSLPVSEPGNSLSLACLLSPPAPLDSVASLTFMYLGTCCSPPGMPFHSSCSPGMRAHLSIPSSNGSLAELPGSLSSLALLCCHNNV